MKTYIAHLSPKAEFLNELPRSDTLFGAICWGYRILFENDFPEFIESFRASPPSPKLLLSSAFPYLPQNVEMGLEKDVHLLPKPIGEPIYFSPKWLDDSKKAKRYKRILLVTEGLFQQMTNISFDETIFYQTVHCSSQDLTDNDLNKDCVAMGVGMILYEKDIVSEVDVAVGKERMSILNPIVKDTTMRNSTDRIGGGVVEGRLFTSDCAKVRRQTGLYFLLRMEEEEKHKIEAVLRFLADGGIGGDLGVGKGWYGFSGLQEASDLFHKSTVRRGFVTLSLYYCPAAQLRGFDTSKTWYQLVPRKGKVDNLYIDPHRPWKKTKLLFKEGSTFVLKNGEDSQTFYGINPIVSQKSDNHYFDVQMFGFAFPIPLWGEENECSKNH